MAVWIRRGAWTLAVVVLVLAAVATWFVVRFDADQAKAVAVDWMKTHRQRTLVIDGPLELSVFPRLGVKVSKLRLSEAGRPDTFASADQAGLSVDVLPLLRGEIVVGRIDAHGVRLTYRRDAAGRSNIDDLLRSEPGPTPATPGPGKAMRFDVSGIELSDVRAQVKDDLAGVQGGLVLKSFSSGRLANQVEAPVTLDAQLDLQRPAVKGALSGSTRLLLNLDTRSVALRDAKLAFKGDAPGASAMDAALQGSVAWDGATKRIEAQSVALRWSGHTGVLTSDGSSLDLERFAFEPARRVLSLRKLQARVKGTQAGLPLTLDLDWPELAVQGDALSGSGFTGKLTRGGAMPLTATFRSGAPGGNFDAVHLPGVEAQLQSNAAARQLTGTLRTDLRLQPGDATLVFDKLELQAKVQEPQLQPMALGVRGNAVASLRRSSWKLAGQLNDNRFTSDGSATLAGGTPQIEARAQFDALDLNGLLGQRASGAASAPPSPAKGAVDTPVDLSPLRSVNGRFSLQAGRFVFRQYRVDDAHIAATLDGGVLRIGELRGKAWGGELATSAVADARNNRIALKGAASGVNVNALVKDVAAKDWIEGTGRVSWDLDSSGRSVNELKSRLQGSAALQIRDGAIKGFNLAKALRDARAALSQSRDATQRANQTEKTDFTELSASFQIADGVARSRDLDLKSPFLRLGGEGAIDVGRGRIDYLARATVAPTSQGQGGAELAALKGLTVPVRLAGPFDAVDWKIEWSAVAAAAVRQQIENKLTERLGLKPPAGGASQPSATDALKKSLRGLFK